MTFQKKILSKNFNDLINSRRKNYFKIEKFAEKRNITPIIKKLSQNSNPWCYQFLQKILKKELSY